LNAAKEKLVVPEVDPPLAENCHPVGDSAESAVRLRRLSVRQLADSRGGFLVRDGSRGEMRSD